MARSGEIAEVTREMVSLPTAAMMLGVSTGFLYALVQAKVVTARPVFRRGYYLTRAEVARYRDYHERTKTLEVLE